MRVDSHRYSVGIVLTVEDNDDGLTGIATEACEADVIFLITCTRKFVEWVKV